MGKIISTVTNEGLKQIIFEKNNRKSELLLSQKQAEVKKNLTFGELEIQLSSIEYEILALIKSIEIKKDNPALTKTEISKIIEELKNKNENNELYQFKDKILQKEKENIRAKLIDNMPDDSDNIEITDLKETIRYYIESSKLKHIVIKYFNPDIINLNTNLNDKQKEDIRQIYTNYISEFKNIEIKKGILLAGINLFETVAMIESVINTTIFDYLKSINAKYKKTDENNKMSDILESVIAKLDVEIEQIENKIYNLYYIINNEYNIKTGLLINIDESKIELKKIKEEYSSLFF